jgi:magnesium transporter
MPLFGSTANTYASHQQLMHLASFVSPIRGLVVPALSFSTKRLHSGVSDRLFKATDHNLAQHSGLRHLSWLSKTNSKSVEFSGFSESQEEVAKAAILEKVMKGRQPTDLMLRCE